MKPITLFFFLLAVLPLRSQEQPPFTSADQRIKSMEQRKELEAASIVNQVAFRSAGPTIFSGRVDDIEVHPGDPSHFYVAYASGGLWKTENNGTSFSPLFDSEMVMTIGDIAVNWPRNIIWVGTGEANSSRSSYSGVGMYKSTDGGKSWQHLGLGESHHISRIILHPADPNTVWVAALGHLYSPNPERGVYKTTDGGKTWRQTLSVNENTGAADLIIDPDNPKILYAAMWERTRRAWDFTEGGNGTSIFKSTDGGESWQILTDGKNGFPTGPLAGRIGLALYKKAGKNILYAAIDNYDRRPKEKEEEDVLTRDDLFQLTKAQFLQLPKYQIKDFLTNNRFPEKYSVEKVLAMVKNDEIQPQTLAEYLEEPNQPRFDTEVIGLEIYRSEDQGKNWKKTHSDFLDAYSSFGYYFGQIRVSPHNPDKIYLLGVPVIRSDDGGKTFQSIGGDNVHSDHHALWVNPKRDGHLILGNDGGLNISYDDGETWIKCNTPAVGQFYAIAVDMAQPYNVYGGLQDNGVWMGPNTYEASTRWHSSGQYPYKSIMGGDGMQVEVDTRDNATVYTGFQFGVYFRLNTKTGQRKSITPQHDLGERPLRWNWQTPIHLSVHNQDILYMGSHKLHRSFDQGNSFEAISGDLTTGGRTGDVSFGTLTTIHESPLKFGLLYTGSDDGLVHITQDGGNTWTRISDNLPGELWVSRVQASAHDLATVYVALNGYRWDDFTPYLYRSENYGKTWEKIGTDLPLEPVNVIKEDPVNAHILYVGTDHGAYVSLDKGKSFMQMNNGIPAVPVHDLVVHPRDLDLVVGTHGRSVYIGSVKELQQLTEEMLAKPIYAFEMAKVRYNPSWGRQFASWSEAREPEIHFPVYTNSAGKAIFTVKTESGLVLATMETDLVKGLNYPAYKLSVREEGLEDYNKWLNEKVKPGEKPIRVKKADNGTAYLYRGKYSVVAEKGGEKSETTFVVE